MMTMTAFTISLSLQIYLIFEFFVMLNQFASICTVFILSYHATYMFQSATDMAADVNF